MNNYWIKKISRVFSLIPHKRRMQLYAYMLVLVMFLFITSCFVRKNLFDLAHPNNSSESSTSTDFEVVDVCSTSCTGIRVTFSWDTEKISAETSGNYSIPGLSVTDAFRDKLDFSIVYLSTSSQSNMSYTLTVTGIIDINNNPILAPYNSRIFMGDAAPFLQNTSSHYIAPDYFVDVYFSEPVDTVSSEDELNYSIPDLTIISAMQNVSNHAKVTLVTSAQTNGLNYTLTVSNVMDTTANTVTSPNSMSFLGTGVVDTVPPTIVFATLIDENTVEVQFSEPVDQPSAETSGNYLIEDNAGNPVTVGSATRQTDDSKVWLDICGIFSKNIYFLTVSTSVEDVNGNMLDPSGNTVSFAGQGTNIFSVLATSNINVQVTFSNNVELTAAQTLSNYSIPGLTIVNAVRDGVDFSVVHLTTSPHEDVNYILIVSGFIDQDSKKFGGDVAPYIESVCSYSNTEVVVSFSEKMDVNSVEDETNYTTSPVLSIVSATQDASDPSRVVLVTGSQGDGTKYTLIINGVRDLNENPIASQASMDFLGTGTTDNTSPLLMSAELIDSNTVCIQFSEPIEQTSSEDTLNYTIKDTKGVTVALSAATRQPDSSKVYVDVSGVFSESLYRLTVSTNVCDMSANSLVGPPENSVSFNGEGTIPLSFTDGPVIEDPLDEGTSNAFSMLAKYRGRIYIGPADADNRVFRIKPDGSDPELVTFTFHVGASYTASLDPGPDGEDGIDYIAGGNINGTEYFFIGPHNSGDVKYIYFTSGSGVTLEFTPMDLDAVTGGLTKGVSAMIVLNNNLYIGFPDTGGSRPYLHRIINIKENPVQDVDVIDLAGDKMPRIGVKGNPKNGSDQVGIDSFGILGNQLYLANGGKSGVDEDGGILRSMHDTPGDYKNYPGDWADGTFTPTSNIDWYNSPLNDRFSKELSKLDKLTPSDKAFPAMAEFNGSLFVLRNTSGTAGGPQLWKYDGSNWSLVAGNGSGITNMGDSANSSITLLVVNGDRLYIGYDNNINGIQIWRTIVGVIDPMSESDFQPVSTDGLGDPANNQKIYHGLSIADGGVDYLWLLCGKSGGSIKVFRTCN